MAWLEMHQSLRRHRKLLHAARLLNVADPDLLRAKIENIWWWCLDNAEEGVITIDKALPLEVWVVEAAGWQGHCREFADALLESGWLEKSAAGNWGYKLEVHDWWDYAGKLIDKRKADRDRKRAERSSGRPSDGAGNRTNRTVPTVPTVPTGGEPPLLAAPGTTEEDREVDRTVGAFGFCGTPGVSAKQAAIRDLRRLGLSHEYIRATAGKRTSDPFYEIVRALEKGRPSPKSPKTCRTCANLEKVVDHEKTPAGAKETTFKPCPDCAKRSTG